MRGRRSVTSLCTVDLLTAKCAEHARTVQPVATMYSAHRLVLSSIYSHKMATSVFFLTEYIYVGFMGNIIFLIVCRCFFIR